MAGPDDARLDALVEWLLSGDPEAEAIMERFEAILERGEAAETQLADWLGRMRAAAHSITAEEVAAAAAALERAQAARQELRAWSASLPAHGKPGEGEG